MVEFVPQASARNDCTGELYGAFIILCRGLYCCSSQQQSLAGAEGGHDDDSTAPGALLLYFHRATYHQQSHRVNWDSFTVFKAPEHRKDISKQLLKSNSLLACGRLKRWNTRILVQKASFPLMVVSVLRAPDTIYSQLSLPVPRGGGIQGFRDYFLKPMLLHSSLIQRVCMRACVCRCTYTIIKPQLAAAPVEGGLELSCQPSRRFNPWKSVWREKGDWGSD